MKTLELYCAEQHEPSSDNCSRQRHRSAAALDVVKKQSAGNLPSTRHWHTYKMAATARVCQTVAKVNDDYAEALTRLNPLGEGG